MCGARLAVEELVLPEELKVRHASEPARHNAAASVLPGLGTPQTVGSPSTGSTAEAVTLIGGVCAGIEPWPVFFCIPEHCSRAGAGGLAVPQEFEEREIHVTHRRVSHDENVLARLQWAMVFCHTPVPVGTVCHVRVCDAPVARG